ncbi:DUF6402 family protein [Burkholderia arboris]|uniref:DUF6402 family protein n=1 Tax=Burkholderia arboris TaxID=488730 RepID=UPI0021CD15EA|nr:DUF6402 family protein [Burkholderia arboris]
MQPYNDDPASSRPLNDDDVSLDWALKFGSVKRKYEKPLSSDIYSERSIRTASDITHPFVKKLFFDRNSTFNFNTSSFIGNFQKNFTGIGNFNHFQQETGIPLNTLPRQTSRELWPTSTFMSPLEMPKYPAKILQI